MNGDKDGKECETSVATRWSRCFIVWRFEIKISGFWRLVWDTRFFGQADSPSQWASSDANNTSNKHLPSSGIAATQVLKTWKLHSDACWSEDNEHRIRGAVSPAARFQNREQASITRHILHIDPRQNRRFENSVHVCAQIRAGSWIDLRFRSVSAVLNSATMTHKSKLHNKTATQLSEYATTIEFIFTCCLTDSDSNNAVDWSVQCNVVCVVVFAATSAHKSNEHSPAPELCCHTKRALVTSLTLNFLLVVPSYPWYYILHHTILNKWDPKSR